MKLLINTFGGSAFAYLICSIGQQTLDVSQWSAHSSGPCAIVIGLAGLGMFLLAYLDSGSGNGGPF